VKRCFNDLDQVGERSTRSPERLRTAGSTPAPGLQIFLSSAAPSRQTAPWGKRPDPGRTWRPCLRRSCAGCYGRPWLTDGARTLLAWECALQHLKDHLVHRHLPNGADRDDALVKIGRHLDHELLAARAPALGLYQPRRLTLRISIYTSRSMSSRRPLSSLCLGRCRPTWHDVNMQIPSLSDHSVAVSACRSDKSRFRWSVMTAGFHPYRSTSSYPSASLALAAGMSHAHVLAERHPIRARINDGSWM